MMAGFWKDEVGVVISAELVLILTLLVIGMIVGLTSLRDGVIEELADVGGAIGSQNQSFVFSSVFAHPSSTGGSVFTDQLDFGDNGASPGAINSRCVVIGAASPISGGEGTGT
jgi:Flp pilus assembly pilin Flp